MKKLLLTPSFFVDALISKNSFASKILELCKQDETLQAWTLATTPEILLTNHILPTKIKNSLHTIAQIPLDSYFNEKALTGKYDYQTNYILAACERFKLNFIIDSKIGLKVDSKIDSSCNFEVLDYEVFLKEYKKTTDYKPVPFLDLHSHLHSIYDEITESFTEIIQNNAFAGGNYVTLFEEKFAQYCETKYAVGVSNGTDALRFALLAMGVKPGDEVITVPHTFIATTEAISQVGAIPVFVDICKDTYNINPDLIEQKITSKTKVILPVHLYGQPAEMDLIHTIANKHDLQILEDAAQAHGAKYKTKRAGSLGNVAAFSMYPGKNLGAFGEAGAITTNNPEIADKIRCLREHGQFKKYYHEIEGYNGRMDNLQAASIYSKLRFLDGWNQKRRFIASLYQKGLQNIPQITLPKVSDDIQSVYHLYVILVPKPIELEQYLKEKNISTGFHYPIPLHLQKAYQHRQEGKGTYPVSEYVADHLISLPMFPHLQIDQINRVIEEIQNFYQN